MRSASTEDPSDAARRRLELLRRELDQAGLLGPAPSEAVSSHDEAPVLMDPGRHARPSSSPWARVRGFAADRLPATLRGRVGLDGATIAVVAVVAAVGLAVSAWFVLRSGSGAAPVPVSAPMGSPLVSPPVSPLVSPMASPVGAGPAAGAAAPASAAEVVVDVSGKVKRPGVFTLPVGSRVIDAIARAGGLRPGARLRGLNRARVLVDGEQILVGLAPAPGVAAGAVSSPGASVPGTLLNLNSATQSQLEELPGVGPVTAGKIMTWRTQHGRFTSVDELLEVDGIGEKTLAELAPHVTL